MKDQDEIEAQREITNVVDSDQDHFRWLEA